VINDYVDILDYFFFLLSDRFQCQQEGVAFVGSHVGSAMCTLEIQVPLTDQRRIQPRSLGLLFELYGMGLCHSTGVPGVFMKELMDDSTSSLEVGGVLF
jgi:hypothetical protein